LTDTVWLEKLSEDLSWRIYIIWLIYAKGVNKIYKSLGCVIDPFRKNQTFNKWYESN
jgi:hypothetical protein